MSESDPTPTDPPTDPASPDASSSDTSPDTSSAAAPDTPTPRGPDDGWMVCEPASGDAFTNEAERGDAPAPTPQEG